MNKLISFFSWIIIIVLLILIIHSFWQAYQPREQRLQGQIEARQYNVSSKIPGRIDKILVRKGDRVKKKQLLYTLLSPELEAKMVEAKAMSDAAEDIAQEAIKGARIQEVAAAKDNWKKARAAAQLFQKTYQRVNNLYNEGVIAEQKKDEAYTEYQAALYTQHAARQLYDMAEEGTRIELRKASQDKARAAEGAVAEVKAYTDETQVITWHDGEVTQVLLHSGEIAPAGFPVLTVMDMSDVWAVFHVREDLLSQYQLGSEFSVSIPAIGNKIYPFKVNHVSVMGDYATWRATDSSKGFDMRTFEVEAKPLQPITGIRVGMSVLVQPPVIKPIQTKAW
jgi:HlyD family secretion protein